jgi:thiamine-monophosphate kinase
VTRAPIVADLGERELVARVRARVGLPPPWVRLGLGDDAALVEPVGRALEVLTTDALVEGVHFDRACSTAGDIGSKALAVNLSDLAAMGATPRAALLSLGLPAGLELADFDDLVSGFADTAARHRLAVVGGNITRSPGPLLVDVTVTGAVHARKALTRAGGRPGDALYVTGRPGAAAAGLASLRLKAVGARMPESASAALDEAAARHCRPEPRVRLGMLVGRSRAASACIDLSDGLGDAVRQMAEASGVGALIDLAEVPWHPAAAAVWPDETERLSRMLASDDYELLFAVPARRRRAFDAVALRPGGPPVTRIGRLTVEREVLVQRAGEPQPLPAGYAHFA